MAPVVIAHRGASAAHPENTLVAFRAAAGLGADWVELDVRRTRDGQLVVHHDAHLADGRAVVTVARAELPGAVPGLDEALAACAEVGLAVNVEIKSNPDEPDHDPGHAVVPGVLAAIAGARLAGVLVTSFDPTSVARVRDLAGPEVPTGALRLGFSRLERTLDRIAAAGHVSVNPWDGSVDATVVAAARERGLAVNPWTVDDPARLAELARLGVDGLITNVPDVARAVLDADRP